MWFIDEVVNGANLDVVSDLWSTDLRWHGGSLGEFLASLRAAVGGGFSDMHLIIHDTIVSGDKVVLRFANSGLHTGEFMGAAPSGKHAEWFDIGIYQVRDGKIAEGWFGEDALGLLTQLGVVQLDQKSRTRRTASTRSVKRSSFYSPRQGGVESRAASGRPTLLHDQWCGRSANGAHRALWSSAVIDRRRSWNSPAAPGLLCISGTAAAIILSSRALRSSGQWGSMVTSYP
ncbi:ester cyclase [Polymorphospora sp. NPDC050346]|uniref:ester cyclase n=1 Tax=Polymorphospora sp. NPDC050346 TaxID=3155780 RepID=UPI00340A780D